MPYRELATACSDVVENDVAEAKALRVEVDGVDNPTERPCGRSTTSKLAGLMHLELVPI